MNDSPHQDQVLLTAGEDLKQAHAAMIMIHGRGAPAQDILGLASHFKIDGFAYLAPQAARHSWYPDRFIAPLEANEPWLSSALRRIGQILAYCAQEEIEAERTILLGFSQGACLSLEYAARNARRYGGLAALSGGLIGPPEVRRQDQGDLEGTPVFLGCSDVDPHIPLERVEYSADHLETLGGQVTKRIYSGLGHMVIPDEIEQVRTLMRSLLAG
ncbi:MAG TPA: phospholipase [Acidobacteriota bacterium]|nr:phospholipase [Acidobacteriota bacterium]